MLARMGYEVEAIEYIPHHIEIFNLFAACCQSGAAIINYMFKNSNVKQLVADGRLDPETFTVRYTPADVCALRLKPMLSASASS